MKPRDLVRGKVKATRVNEFIIDELEVDLQHINFGLDKEKNYRTKKRSNFSFDDVAGIITLYQLN